jgi:hypothetical protein
VEFRIDKASVLRVYILVEKQIVLRAIERRVQRTEKMGVRSGKVGGRWKRRKLL